MPGGGRPSSGSRYWSNDVSCALSLVSAAVSGSSSSSSSASTGRVTVSTTQPSSAEAARHSMVSTGGSRSADRSAASSVLPRDSGSPASPPTSVAQARTRLSMHAASRAQTCQDGAPKDGKTNTNYLLVS
eukprot:scaffold6213_cov51-Phaeocystis_antarctica.AAC.2